jgi:hypothetical protein
MMGSMMRRAMLGDGSTLSLDFTQMSTLADLTSRGLTFSRSTSGTFINASGLVATATAGNPRFEYDTNGNPRGLLIEASATNLLKHSAYADTNWLAYGGYTKSYTTGINSPANDTTAARITFSAVGNGLYTNNTQMAYTNTVGATYTMSAWIRATSNTTNPNIRFGDSAVATGPNIPISTSWVRYSYSYVAVSASGPLIQSASGTATGEFEMWGFQLEAGSGASSYIPSGASQGSRASESLYLDGAAFSAFWPSGQSELSVYFAGDITRPPANTQFLWVSRTGSGGVGTSRTRSFITTANSIRANTTVSDLNSTLSAAINTRIRTAVGVRSGSCALATNNGTTSTIVVNTDTGLSTDATQLVFNPNADVFQHVSSLKFWPTRLPDAQLEALIT